MTFRTFKAAALAAGAAASISLATPAQALSHHDWDVASTIGVIGLGGVAMGGPVVGGDWPGFWQAGGSMLAGGGIAYGLKSVIHEQRPDHSGNDSFPSAHSAVAFAAAASMQRRYGWEVGIPATLVATFVGVARVKADKHHWYDVVGGAVLGEASGLLITKPFDDSVRLFPWGDSHGGGVAADVRF